MADDKAAAHDSIESDSIKEHVELMVSRGAVLSGFDYNFDVLNDSGAAKLPLRMIMILNAELAEKVNAFIREELMGQ